MSINIAINGFGRIGRLVFRQMFGSEDINIVAINDLTSAGDLAYLLKYDTAQGSYKVNEITSSDDSITVDDQEIKIYAKPNAVELPWSELKIDVVMECSGFYASKEKSQAHLDAGAKKVVISAPAKGDLKTIVYNVNDSILDGSEKIVSGASCTTNCLAPVAKILNDKFGVVKGFMTTIHAYTNDQNTLDGPHPKGIKARRGRAAASNIVPTSTGAAAAVGLVLPKLAGKLDGMALRVPTITGSVVDLVVELEKSVTVEEINKAMKEAANESFCYTEDPIVSSDVIGSSFGSIFDSLSTSVIEVEGKQLVKLIAWYDNEMSYTSQMVRLAKKIASL